MDDAQRIPEPLHSNVIGNTTRYEEAPTNTGLPRDSRLLRLSDRLHVAVSLVAVGPFASFSDISTDDYHDSGVHRVGYWFLHVGPPRRQRTDPATQHRRRLVWAADGTRFAGYRLDKYTLDGVLIHPIYSNSARIWAEGCSLEVRFGTRGGERRAYVTADYGHDNPGTVVDIEVAGGTLSVTRTGVFPPGSPTLSGVVFEVTPTGQLPVEGAAVLIGISSGYRGATTDRAESYRIPGRVDFYGPVDVSRDGYQTRDTAVSISGDTEFDISLVRH